MIIVKEFLEEIFENPRMFFETCYFFATEDVSYVTKQYAIKHFLKHSSKGISKSQCCDYDFS